MQASYSEGDWFAVPLLDEGYGVGVIARMQPERSGVLLGYFFGPRRAHVPEVDELAGLVADDAVLVRLFGHLDIVRGRWPIVGGSPDWDRSAWPTPRFARRPSLGPPVLVTRSDNDPGVVVGEVVIRDGDPLVGTVPEGLLGATLAADRLTRCINENNG